MIHVSRNRTIAALAVTTSLMVAGCGATAATPTATGTSPSAVSPAISGSPGSATATANTTGFAFAVEDIIAYYESQGYVCAAPKPSTNAADFMVRTCQVVDDAGRTRVVGLVTDRAGNLANGFASLKGTASETILAPIDALYPLSGFLGATLGEEQGAALLTWLASHLGDARAETTSGPVTVATHTGAAGDHTTLYVEVSNRAYLDASPVASPSPQPGSTQP